MSRLTTAHTIHTRLNAGFRYKAEEREHWQSLADLVRAGATWSDDCDGYALTAAQIAVEDYDVPEKDVALVHCTVETGEHHLVCFLSDEASTFVVDNRQSGVWTPEQLERRGYRWIRGLTIGEGEWRKPA